MSAAAFASPFTLNEGISLASLWKSLNSNEMGLVTLNWHSAISIGLPSSSLALCSILTFHSLFNFSDFSINSFFSASDLMFSASFSILAFSSTNFPYLSGSDPNIPNDELPPEHENNSGMKMATSAMSLMIFIMFLLVK